MLTPKQLAFANHYLDGKGPSEAHQLAGYAANGNPKVIAVKAQEVLNHPEVAAYIEQKRQELGERAQVDRVVKLKVLGKIITKEDKPDLTRIKAIEVHNVMTGDNAPQEVNVFGLTELLTLVRKKA